MKRVLAMAAALTLTCSAAYAQDVWGWSIIIPSVTGTDILGQQLRQQVQRPPAAAARPASRTQPAPSLTFVASPERRRANFDRFVAERRSADPATAKQLQALLADPDLMPKIDRELRPRGLRTDNVADAYAVWWIQAWQAAHGQTVDPSPPAVRAVKAQAERAFLASPDLLSSGDAAKQEFAEGLLIQAVILGAALDQVKADPVQLRALGQIARGSARQVGVDLDSMVLTDGGFTPAGG